MTGRLRRGLRPESALAILVILAAVGLAAMAARAAPASKAPFGAPTKSSADKSSDPSSNPSSTKGLGRTDEAFSLPDDWRNDDGTFNQASIIEQQKKRLEVISKVLKVQMKMVETKHYLLFSSAADPVTKTFSVGCEALYASLHRQLGIPTEEPVWDGKCILLLFATTGQYQDYRKLFDGGIVSGEAAAYFLWERRVDSKKNPATYPQLMHICIPLERSKPQTLQRCFAHEGTHAFIALYHKPTELPLWLDEGLAEYMTIVNDPSLRPDMVAFAKDYSARGHSLRSMFDDKATDLPAEQYPVAATMVECLLTQGGAKFKQLIWNLKDGMKEDQALKAIYGVDTAGLEKTWHEYIARQSTAIRPR